MKHDNPRQKGYFILALTAVIVVITLSFVLGYSVYYAKREQYNLAQNQQEYILEVKNRLLDAYAAHFADVDADLSEGTYRSGDVWLKMAGINNRWGLSIGVSSRQSKTGVMYTSISVWLPTDEDATNPPSYNVSTGAFTTCSVLPCAPRISTTFDGYSLQLAAASKAHAQLNELATKATAHFKARQLLDPLHNIATNHFRAGTFTCGTVNADTMPCLDTYTELQLTPVGALIGVDSPDMSNPWGRRFEVSNLQDSNTASVPYSMSFTTTTPWGSVPPYQVLAVEPL